MSMDYRNCDLPKVLRVVRRYKVVCKGLEVVGFRHASDQVELGFEEVFILT